MYSLVRLLCLQKLMESSRGQEIYISNWKWGYVIILCKFMTNMNSGITKAFGVLLEVMVERFNTNYATVGIICTLPGTIMLFSGKFFDSFKFFKGQKTLFFKLNVSEFVRRIIMAFHTPSLYLHRAHIHTHPNTHKKLPSQSPHHKLVLTTLWKVMPNGGLELCFNGLNGVATYCLRSV